MLSRCFSQVTPSISMIADNKQCIRKQHEMANAELAVKMNFLSPAYIGSMLSAEHQIYIHSYMYFLAAKTLGSSWYQAHIYFSIATIT